MMMLFALSETGSTRVCPNPMLYHHFPCYGLVLLYVVVVAVVVVAVVVVAVAVALAVAVAVGVVVVVVVVVVVGGGGVGGVGVGEIPSFQTPYTYSNPKQNIEKVNSYSTSGKSLFYKILMVSSSDRT